jgi:Na+-translocating ferredoxin:NAD+ oxidoreductase RnfG subunit
LTLDKNIKALAEKFAKQRFLGKFVYYYEIYKSNDIIGYAILDNVKGKVKPITFLVIFNTDYSVNSVDIIKYREQYGGAVENRSWLDQFNSKSVESELELNETIDGISGATISVKSVLNGVKRLLYFISNLGEYERNLFVSIE